MGKERNARYIALMIAVMLSAAIIGMSATGADGRAAAAAYEPKILIPGGKSVGIAMATEGVVVIGMSDVGESKSPARAAGLKGGDVITAVNGVPVSTAQELTDLLTDGERAQIDYTRGGDAHSAEVLPVRDGRDGRARIGAWVRTDTAGVGTLTYIDPATNDFGALGHAVADVDTGVTLPLSEGAIYNSRVVQIERGQRGAPGEIVGDFIGGAEQIGDVTDNTDFGLFGSDYCGGTDDLPYANGLPAAERSQIHTGSAQILTTIDDRVRAFDCVIEHLSFGREATMRSIVLHITDPELIERTGGIVQGMSGSPIVQDGLLVGAVTHVFVNDPTRGYGICIGDMLTAAEREQAV